jgi:cytochrome c peroxidase
MRQRPVVLYLLISVTVAALLARHIVTQARDSNDPSGSEARVELGRLLFWDPILSGHKDIACATCHHPDFAYADGRDLSRGTAGRNVLMVTEGCPSVLGRSAVRLLPWSGRTAASSRTAGA